MGLLGGEPAWQLSGVWREYLPLTVRYDPALSMWRARGAFLVRAVLRDPVTYRPDNALTAVHPLGPATLGLLARAGFALPPTLANNGAPSHDALRRFVAGFLGPAQVREALPYVQQLARGAANVAAGQLDRRGTCDLVATVTRDLPAYVLLRVLGIAGLDVEQLKRWSAAALELFWGRPDQDRQLALAAEVARLHRWITVALHAAGRDDPGLFGALARLRDTDGHRPGHRQAAALAFFLLVAGHETTSQLLAATLHRILRTGAWGQPAAVPAAIDAVLRDEPPVSTWRRTTSVPVRLGGADLPAGATLLLDLAAGDSSAPVAFGAGPHFCPGATLARAEAVTVGQVVVGRLPGLVLAGPVPVLRLLSFRAPQVLPVRYGPAGTGIAPCLPAMAHGLDEKENQRGGPRRGAPTSPRPG